MTDLRFATRALVLCGIVILCAVQASGISIALNQVGGTAVGGFGQIGDTVVVSIDVTLEEGDATTAIGPALSWDLEGGDVLDILSATEAPFVPTASIVLAPINGRYIVGTPGGSSRTIDPGESFPRTRRGATFAWGWEQVTLDSDGGTGPASFSVGTAEFVFRESGTTTLSFLLGNTPRSLNTFVYGADFVDITDQVSLGTITLGSLQLTAVPEPGTGALLAFGLLSLAAGRSRRRLDA